MHVFLTGEKRVGKSTVIQHFLQTQSCKLGGFLTVRKKDEITGKAAVYMLDAARSDMPTEENRLFDCGEKIGAKEIARFDALGTKILAKQQGAELLLMDELGPKEANALQFQQAVLRALDGDIPILGVLQKAETPFLQTVAQHKKVRVITVTTENREELPSKIAQWLAE